ncbi:P-loop containing nucleoside triphosphate hydrolase protein [Neocallimastix californiae]|uniref:ATP-dependent RNA helicase n=1 Tax=Neocallimastix californiae TaxID=1754190 RepID=A0A1Y2BTF2_9FUNG|nr:P-loop containing nucleoside triphosphate hydrolase protein [Neocallimastix californiae]|eukprot:ORY38038.1 P-loop containing nucleoside triphosphate hydrolase protein [Neocallimastix californiae]
MAQNKRKRNNKGIIKMSASGITDINIESDALSDTTKNNKVENNKSNNNNDNNKQNKDNNNNKKPAENVNKKNNKRRKLNKNNNNNNNKDDSSELAKLLKAEEEWKKISTEELPPIPTSTKPNNSKNNKNKNKNNNNNSNNKNNNNNNNSNNKNKKNKNKKKGKNNNNKKEEDDSEFIDLKDIDNWGWSEINYDKSLLGSEDVNGFLSLEEIKDVEVVYEGDDKGKILRFKNGKLGIGSDDEEDDEDDEYGNMDINDILDDKMDVDADNSKKEATEEKEEDNDDNFDISAWKDYSLNPSIEKALKALKFSKPTEIQAQTLNLSLKDKRDIIGAAETGSGKTLAFGLPIIQHIASTPKEQRNYCSGLILTPTRELAIQIKQHLMAISKYTDAFIVAIVGGMSTQKQQRLIKQKPDLIIATPGRLWELMSDYKEFAGHLRTTRFLVLDEADRMLESGHFRELEYILNIISKKRNKTKDENLNFRRQIAVYSATLISDKELHTRIKKNNEKNNNTTFVKLIKQLEFEDKNPSYVNLLSQSIMAKPLTETKINCLQTEKDLYLYYFAILYPGKTIVFVNSIDCIRRLIPIMNLLNIKTFGLHAQMQQRQRLKNLDRFRDSDNALLITSDVAARGLDIPAVDHVIHYQLPRSADIYVHRSGRTARAEREGISIALCSPEELRLYKNLCSSLKKPNGIEDFPVDRLNMNSLKERISLALEIDKLEHKIQKTSQHNSWIKKAAEEMDVILDEDLLEEDSDVEENKRNKNRENNKLKGLKNKLKALLDKPIVPIGLSTKYLTSSTISNLPEVLLREKGKNTNILAQNGFKALNAVNAVKAHKNKK